MDIAKLQVVLAAEEARKQTEDLKKGLQDVGKAADAVSAGSKPAFSAVTTNMQGATTQAQQLGTAVQRTAQQMQQATTATQQAAAAMGAGGGGGGRGLAGGAASASGAVGGLSSQLTKLVTAFLAFRTVANVVETLVQTRIEFERLDFGLRAVTGSWAAAATESQFLREEVDRLGLNLKETIPEFVKIEAAFSQAGFSGREARQMFTDISIVTKALGLSTASTNRILYDFQEMVSLGTVQMRQLRQVLMQIPGGLQVAARSVGVTTEEFHRLVHEGLLPADEFVTKFASELAKTFGGAMEEAAQNMESSVNRMRNSWSQLVETVARGPVGDLIKASIDSIDQSLKGATAAEKIDQFYRQIGGANATFDQQRSALQKRFPSADLREMEKFEYPWYDVGGMIRSARGAGIPSDYFPKYYKSAEQQQRDADMLYEQARQAGRVPSITEVPKEERTSTEKQLEDKTRILELTEKLNAESLQGLEREKALIDYNSQKQLHTLVKMLRGFDSVKDANKLGEIFAAGDPFEAIAAERQRAMDEAIQKDQFAKESKTAKELTDEYKSQQAALEKLVMEGIAPADKAAEELNKQFRDQVNELIQLDEAGVDVGNNYERLLKARDDAMARIQSRRNKAGFTGENFGQLRSGIRSDELGLLTETDAEKFQEIAQRIQDRSSELARRLKGDALTISEAWQVGLDRQSKSWGSFDERVASSAEQTADSLDRNFTDAFSSLIDGTKSASQAFSDMATSIVKDIVRIAVQQLLVRSVLQGFSGLGGLFGGAQSSGAGAGTPDYTAGIPAGAGHFGGEVGSFALAGSRNMSAMAIAGARRMHTGGVVGDEMPIVARRGEVVFTPEQMAFIGDAISKSKQSTQHLSIYNVMDDSAFDAALMRRKGSIVNIIGQERKAVRAVISG